MARVYPDGYISPAEAILIVAAVRSPGLWAVSEEYLEGEHEFWDGIKAVS